MRRRVKTLKEGCLEGREEEERTVSGSRMVSKKRARMTVFIAFPCQGQSVSAEQKKAGRWAGQCCCLTLGPRAGEEAREAAER